jgi:hypothetical protein
MIKTARYFALLAFVATRAAAQNDTSTEVQRAEPAFEIAGPVEAKQFVNASSMLGRNHRVGPTAYNDGMMNTYFLEVGQQTHEVTGSRALVSRIREVYAIEKMRGMSKTNEFKKAVGNAGKQKVDSVVGLVRDPFGTIKRVPKGASRFFGGIGESLKGGGAESEGNALQNLSGVQKAKVALAAKLGVNPYSTNAELQEQLTETSRAMAGGGFVIAGATAIVGGPIVSTLNVNQNLQQSLVNSSPSDLRIVNRKKLFAMGLDREHADEFLMHPWFSPWHETIIVDALDTIGQNPSAFLDQASRALTEQDADYFQRLAQVLARYHKERAQLTAIVVEGGLVCAIDSARTLVVPLSCDYANWNERAAGRVDQFARLRETRPEIKGLALWVDGKLSETAARELRSRNIEIATDVLDSVKVGQ